MMTVRAHFATPARVTRARAEAAFSIIEVIIAMLVLTMVLSAGVMAVAGSERVSRGASIMQQKTSVAQRALERAEGDLAEQSRCNGTVWLLDTPPAFRPCRVSYTDMVDSANRRYRADIVITPVDDASDGQGRADTTRAGTGDSDFQSRDYYRAEVTVTIADSMALASMPLQQRAPYSMASRLDWALNEQASIAVNVCSHYRMDRSVDVAGCGARTNVPVAGVTVKLQPVGTAANAAIPFTLRVGSDGTAQATNVLPAGDYKVTASDAPGFTFYRASPEFLKVQPGARHEVSILMSALPGETRVCYQITNPDDGFGYWVNETNISWRENRSLVYRNGRLADMSDRLKCQESPLPDPLGYDPALFQSDYAFSVQQVAPGAIRDHPDEWGLKVDRVEKDCLGSGSRLAAGGGGNASTLRDDWIGMYRQEAGKHQICLYFQAYPIQAVECASAGPPCILRRSCRRTYDATKPRVAALSDPCVPGWDAAPPTGPFNPCPGGSTGPLQKPGGPDPLGTYKGPVIAYFGGPKMATYYGPGYECRFTASGERFDVNALTASTLTTRGWVGSGWGSCARVWTGKGEAIIKLNDTGGNPDALLDLSIGSTIGLGYRPGDNPTIRVEVVQKPVPNGQGCSAWNVAPTGPDNKCKEVQAASSNACDTVYPPEIVDIWVKPEAPAGSANPGAVPLMGNAGASRRSL